MSDFFESSMRWIVGYGVGAVVFLSALFFINSCQGDQISRSEVQAARKLRASRTALPAGVDLGQMQQEAQAQQKAAVELASQLGRDPGRFSLAGADGVAADLHFNEMVEYLRGPERLERFLMRDIGCDESLGLPDSYPSDDAEFDWYLRGLDIVDQVMAWVITIDREVLPGGVKAIENIQIAAPTRRRSSRRASADAQDYLSSRKVIFDIEGHPIAISALIDRLARQPEVPGRWLALKAVKIETLDQLASPNARGKKDLRDDGFVMAKLTLSAIDIAEGGEAVR